MDTQTIVLNNRVALKGAIDMHYVRPLENKSDNVLRIKRNRREDKMNKYNTYFFEIPKDFSFT